MKIMANLILGFKDRISLRFFIVNSFLLLILSQVLYSQTDSLIIEHYSLEQGLSNSTIRSVIQDREGYLWFTTDNGVVRYDGYEFQSYINKPGDTTSFINDVAWSSYVDKEGTLWFGSGDGLEKYNRRTNNFTNYLLDNFAKGHVIGNIIINILEDKRGIFWVTTGKGVFKFNKISGKFSPVQYNYDSTNSTYTNYNSPFVAKDGSLWFSSGQGLDKFNYESGKIMHYWRDPQNREVTNSTISKYFIHSICEDTNGTLWLGTNKGIVEFNKKSNTFTNYIPDSSLNNSDNVNRLCLDHSGLLWVGTHKGIFTFDTKSKRFTRKFINQSHHDFYYLGNNFVTSLYIDHLGALWVGTLSDGIYRVILKKLPYKRYFPGGVHQVVKGKDGILWIVKDLKGKIKFDTRTEKIIPTNIGTNQEIYTDQSGNMYVKNNNSNYLTKVKDGKIIRYNLLKKAGPLYFEKNIGIWYGATQGGIYFLDFKTGKASKILDSETEINAFCKDSRGLVWAATVMGKLICYNTKNKLVSEYISDPKDPSSISGRTFFDIYEDKTGNVWFATDVGLNRFVPSTKTFVHFTEKDGLSGNTVYDLLEDDHGNLWLGTNKGITKFNPQTNQFKNFDVLHGRSYSKWWNRLAVKMDDGEMFFGRSYGLIRFHPDSIKENNYIPPIVITSIRLFDKPIPFGKDQPEAESAFGEDEPQAQINLTYDKNFLSFEFAALNYYNSERNQYAYKMEGVDKDWVYSGTRRYASYPNMEPGKYLFKVKGSNNDGVWNEAGTSLSIIISPPWWKTWWFRFASIFILFVSAGSAIRYIEMKKIKRKIELLEQEGALERERTRISRDMHDEIGSNLSEITILSELAKKNPNEAEHHMQEISELTSEVIDNVSEIVWAMNPQNDKLDNLIAHTRRYAVKYLGLANINCRFTSLDDLPSHTLSAEFRRNIFLVVKEVLHNIVKHSCASEVLFVVNFSDHNLEMKIEDNGKGFFIEESHASGNGLSNMRKRIEDIGGFITIRSACEKGTQISFSAKINS